MIVGSSKSGIPAHPLTGCMTLGSYLAFLSLNFSSFLIKDIIIIIIIIIPALLHEVIKRIE